ncbi:flavin reductase (DIM6/NTAB) family NADH-FMN oxidoreductase RutF [Halopolyspora algeriensis]|uniref:Flavin reductase (DIM6/NTAB) family NADH-FMN oxidoreductase RutF n=1 Tax=Halopolyspora algeriensis TaxID=1500506 RepID=A0A368VWR4_9ACTN|nr:flavin reductase family protein [Halopolyspora algeriensis]RCW45747.1 flavin reductase (DIM6/NTAB) family NADH-FMN oxidoreductase RutF [Halopolyspora algeriensis]TQM54131.1 flavin reductase (DIM6/NTAB) family NADH-FMN oxidoreductase RutF [Halopolyspora algeriensis]
MRIDPRQLRNCLGHFATGVTVITCDVEGEPHGATVNAFSAVSLDPPLVLVSLDRKTKACQYLEGRPFTVNVLQEGQDDVALHFAGKPRSEPIEWVRPEGVAPWLPGSLARVSCRPWDAHDGGDHVLYVGEVEEFEFDDGRPLVFYLGAFRHLGEAFETVPWLETGDCPSGLSRLVGMPEPVRDEPVAQ